MDRRLVRGGDGELRLATRSSWGRGGSAFHAGDVEPGLSKRSYCVLREVLADVFADVFLTISLGPQREPQVATLGWALRRAGLGLLILMVAVALGAWLFYASIEPDGADGRAVVAERVRAAAELS